MTATLWRVPPMLVEQAWPMVDDHIRDALKHATDTTTEDEILGQCMRSTAQLWIASIDDEHVGTIVTEPVGRALWVRYLAGNRLDRWIGLQDTLGEWGSSRGCDVMRAKGRLGWGRRLLRHGWSLRAVEMEREI